MSYGYAAPYGCAAPAYALQYQQAQVAAPALPPGPPPPPIAPIPELPIDQNCYRPPQKPCPQSAHYCINEPPIVRSAEQHYNTCNTSVQENTIHIQHNRTVVTNVNRNHHHLHRIIVKDNNFHHYHTKNIIRAHDIHHQRIERVKAEGKTFKDFKETLHVEPVASCSKGSSKQAATCAPPAETSPVLAGAPTPGPALADQPAFVIEQGSLNPPEEPYEVIQAIEETNSITPVPAPAQAAIEYHPLPPPPANPPPIDPDRYLSDSEDDDEESARILAIAQQAQQVPRYAPSYDYQCLQSPQVAAAAAYYQYHTQNRYQPQVHSQPNYYGY